jgi:RNA polymerase sigma-70 factor (ECF subfamily)
MIFNFGKKGKKNGFHDWPDHELIMAYRKGENPEIIAELFTRYTHLVYGICLKYFDDKDEAKDAVMEIFEGLTEDIPGFEIRNFKSWLYTVTKNHCLMALRKKKIMHAAEESVTKNYEPEFMESPDELHHDLIRQEFTENQLISAMKGLKEEQKLCLELVYLREKSYQEVSEITGYSLKEVKSHVQNGKRNLKIKLEPLNEEER